MEQLFSQLMELFKPVINEMVEKEVTLRLAKLKKEPQILFKDNLPVTTQILSERMGISKSFIYQKVSKKLIPFEKKCGRLYFIPSEIIEWVKGVWEKKMRKKKKAKNSSITQNEIMPNYRQ